MNILIAATQLWRTNGGVCTHIIDLCKTFTKTETVVLAAAGTDYARQIAEVEGLTYVELPVFEAMERDKKQMITCYRQMRRLCREHKIDIIHLHGQRLIPVAWLLRLTMGIPFLWTNHIDAIPSPGLMAKMWRIMKFPVISVSSDLKTQLIRELSVAEDKITVVNSGVDLAGLQPLTEQETATAREKFGVRHDSFVISEVARIQSVKGQHLLVRAASAVQKAYPQIKLQVLLAGSGNMEWFQTEVLDYAKENGVDCSYIGFCDPREVYGISHLAVLPSLYEGFSISSIEALAMGCPVLRSDSPGYSDMKDLVLVCKTGDQEDLDSQLEWAVKHPQALQKMGAKGRETVPQRFTKETTARQTLAVYRKVLGA